MSLRKSKGVRACTGAKGGVGASSASNQHEFLLMALAVAALALFACFSTVRPEAGHPVRARSTVDVLMEANLKNNADLAWTIACAKACAEKADPEVRFVHLLGLGWGRQGVRSGLMASIYFNS